MNYKLMKTQICDGGWHDSYGGVVKPVGEYISTAISHEVFTTDINTAFLTAAEYNREMPSFSSNYWNGFMKDICGGCKVKVVEA